MSKTSDLLLPRASMAGCVFAAIARDTRGIALCEADRFNHFPASPLVALTYQQLGQTHVVNDSTDSQELYNTKPLPRISVAGPQEHPVTSWNRGEVFIITIGFYPDAWFKLTNIAPASLANQLKSRVPDILRSILESCENTDDATSFWQTFQNGLEPLWATARKGDTRVAWAGHQYISDWTQSLIARAAISGPGQSLRATERRLRRWTGQSRQSLSFYAKFEGLHRSVVNEDTASLAELAQHTGYSDQSHMGRTVLRATGFSPAQLNRLIATKEAFWCYRLLGERF